MPISLSLSKTRLANRQRKFTLYNPQSEIDFWNVISTNVWSPIEWKDGYRLREQFNSCEYIVLDFDDGKTTINELKSFFKSSGHGYIMGTTKSHMKEKKTEAGHILPPCERFRLVLRGDGLLSDLDLYEYNLEFFGQLFGADMSCKDAARFFYPCEGEIHFAPGKRVQWLRTFDEDYIPSSIRYAMQNERIKRRYSRSVWPKWIEEILLKSEEVLPGWRHTTCYRLGLWMSQMGFSEDEINELVLKTSLSDIGEHDVMRAIRNGIAKGEENER